MIFVYLLFLVMAIPDHPFWGSYIGPLTIVKYLGIVCLSYAIFYRATCRGSLKLFEAPQTKLFVALCIVVVVSCLRSPDTFIFNGPFSAFISFLLLFYLVIALIDSRKRLRMTVLVGFGSVALASLYLIREWRVGVAVYGISYRPGWITGDPNYFALSAVLLYPFAVWTIINPIKKIDRWFAIGALVLIAIATVLAASRGGFIGFAVAGLLMLRSSKKKFKVSLAMVGVLSLALILLPSSSIQRITKPSEGDRQSSEFRLQLWQAAWKMMLDRPLNGVGVGQFGSQLPNYGGDEASVFHVPHNTYLSYGAEMGFPGLIVFVMVIGVSIYRMERLRRNAARLGDSAISNLAAAAVAGLTGAAASIFFLSATQSKPLWFVVALSAVLPRFTLAPSSVTEERAALFTNSETELVVNP